jgi:protein-S-isoprenylcysteine O-methyltransferase Ste14
MAVALAFVAFTVQRVEPHRRAREPLAFIVCAVAMGAILVVAQPSLGTSASLLIVGDAVAVTGCVWLLVAVLSLGRCFGVLPEARGLVRRGPYRVVRHPVYLGEIVALIGLTIGAPKVWNVTVLAVFLVAQIVRARFEERALTAAFPEYAQYADQTGRLVPRLNALTRVRGVVTGHDRVAHEPAFLIAGKAER